MTKYNEDQLLQVIRMLEDGMAVKAIAREMRINHNVIRNWRNRYERGGIDQLLSTRQHYTAEFKLEAVAYRRQNELSYHILKQQPIWASPTMEPYTHGRRYFS